MQSLRCCIGCRVCARNVNFGVHTTYILYPEPLIVNLALEGGIDLNLEFMGGYIVTIVGVTGRDIEVAANTAKLEGAAFPTPFQVAKERWVRRVLTFVKQCRDIGIAKSDGITLVDTLILILVAIGKNICLAVGGNLLDVAVAPVRR